MCTGVYSNSLLKIYARIILDKSLNPLKSKTFSFVLDTGAEATILDPKDALLLGIDIPSLKENDKEISGIDGRFPTRILPNINIALVSLVDNFLEFHIENMDEILVGDPQHWNCESILGNDLWMRFNIKTDLENNKFSLSRIPTIDPPYYSFNMPCDSSP